MPYYESVFIARQDLSEQKLEALTNELSGIITKTGGKITKKENWGLRNLAYKIKKNRKGHYVLFNLDAPADTIKEYERQMRINEDILRYLTIKIEQLDNSPSIILSEGSDFRPKKAKIVTESLAETEELDYLDLENIENLDHLKENSKEEA